MLSLVVKPLSTTQWAAVIAQLEATRVAAQPPGLDPSVDPKLMAMIQGYFPAVDCSPPTIRVVPSMPHLQVAAVVVVAVPSGAAVVVVVVVVPEVVGVVVVVVQHGLVGKVGVKSTPNLAREL